MNAKTFIILFSTIICFCEAAFSQNIKQSVDHVKTEMFKQDRQRRRTMDISYVEDLERREMVGKQNTQQKSVIEEAYDD